MPLEQVLEQGGGDGLLLAGGLRPGDSSGAGPGAAAAREQELEQQLPGTWRRIVLGSRPLLLLAHHEQLAGRGNPAHGLPRFLLPATGSARLAEQLEQMGWLALEREPQNTAETLIGRLGQGRLLLPAAGSLLNHSPGGRLAWWHCRRRNPWQKSWSCGFGRSGRQRRRWLPWRRCCGSGWRLAANRKPRDRRGFSGAAVTGKTAL